MTEYQKIENELTSLGWSMDYGSGDHIKFFKEDNPMKIVVSASVSAEGRALKNTYAQIRRIEPRFSLGRQGHMLLHRDANEQGREPSQTPPPDGVPDWMVIGAAVRWTGAEGRDWSLLDKPDSTMNHRYRIIGYKETKDDGPMVIIQAADDGTDGLTFPVFPSDLDAWLLFKCEGCGMTLPENNLYEGDDGKLYCKDCLGRKKDLKDAAAEKVPEEPKKSPVEMMAEKDEVLARFLDAIKVLGDNDFSGIKDEQLTASMVTLKDTYNNVLSSKARKALRNEYPLLIQTLLAFGRTSDEDGDGKVCEYDAWLMSINRLSWILSLRDAAYGEEAHENIRKRLFSSLSYSLKPIKDRKIRRKNVATSVVISSKDEGIAMDVLTYSSLFIEEFSRAVTELPVVVFVNGGSIRQYSVGENAGALELLKKNVPNSELPFLKRDSLNAMLPPIKEVYDKIQGRETVARIAKSAYMLALVYGVHPGYRGDYLDARPVFRLIVALFGKNAGLFDAVVKDFQDGAPFPGPVYAAVIDYEGRRYTAIDRTSEYEYPEGIPDSPEDEKPETDIINLLSIGINPKDGGYDIRLTDDAGKQDSLVNALCESAARNVRLRAIYDQAISSFRERNPGAGIGEAGTGTPLPHVTDNNQSENDSKMEKKDILERTNPGSSRPELGQYSTRELLRELKERGVEFDNLTIIVRESISLDEI